MHLLHETFYGNTVQTWLIALGVAVGASVLLYVIERLIIRRFRQLSKRTETKWDDLAAHVVGKTRSLFLFLVGAYSATSVLELPDSVFVIAQTVLLIALWLQAGIWGSSALMFWVGTQRSQQELDDPAGAMSMNVIGFVGRLVLWAVVLLLVLDNLGVDITALIAGLGVGGIAVALALQNILGDLFASLSIVLDKPFVIGDSIKVGELLGKVETIGIKTTRVRSLSGEQLVFSNADLLGSRIQNFGRLYERRIVFKIGVVYDTPKAKLEKIPSIIQEAVERHEHTRFDRSHFASYGDFSLNFESVYFVTVADYTAYMDAQQAINLELFDRFADEGIEFAYPTQTLLIEQQSA